MYFVQATWYGDLYKADFMAKTGMNETEYDTFFNPSLGAADNSSFGYALAETNFNNSQHLGCIDGDVVPNNCSSQ